jgi:hypothetical protein
MDMFTESAAGNTETNFIVRIKWSGLQIYVFVKNLSNLGDFCVFKKAQIEYW